MTHYISLPKDYKAFPKIIICSNTLINVQVPFEIEEEVPLLIGSDGEPKIWLSARSPKPDMPWQLMIRANRSLHTAAVITGAGTEEVSVTVSGTKVLTLVKRPDDIPEVTYLDLRPVGLNIYGDNSKLMVGTNPFSNKTFQNVNVMVGIGKGKVTK
jgi:hypothetical protein